MIDIEVKSKMDLKREGLEHIDDWLARDSWELTDAEIYASFVLTYFRQPIHNLVKFSKLMESLDLYCGCGDKVYKVIGASKLGYIILSDGKSKDRYTLYPNKVKWWSDTPENTNKTNFNITFK